MKTTAQELAHVEFHGHDLVTTTIDGEPHVALRPICEAIGLDWQGQHARITRHPVLGSVVSMTKTTGGDGKRYEMACMPIKMLNGWLFGVDASRVRPEVQESLVRYQRECFDVLAAYWQQGAATNPRMNKMGAETRLRLDRHSWDLIDRLKRETDPGLRLTYYRQLEATYAELGISTPPLASIGQSGPQQPPAAIAFWEAFAVLERAGVKVNHYRDGKVCAINLGQFMRAAEAHGLALPPGQVLKRELRYSVRPKYLGQRKVNSGLMLRTIHCWLFDMPRSAERPADLPEAAGAPPL